MVPALVVDGDTTWGRETGRPPMVRAGRDELLPALWRLEGSSVIQGQRIEVRVGSGKTAYVTYQGPGLCKRGTAGCRAAFLWCLTEAGKRMPVDPAPDEAGYYTAHWATCPQQKAFRVVKGR